MLDWDFCGFIKGRFSPAVLFEDFDADEMERIREINTELIKKRPTKIPIRVISNSPSADVMTQLAGLEQSDALHRWFELFFELDECPSHCFFDVPVCIIKKGDGLITHKFPEWCSVFIKQIPVYTLSDLNSLTEILNDSVFNRLMTMKAESEKYVNEHWVGFRNSVKRLFGFSSNNNRSLTVFHVKRLADILFCTGRYDEACSYYNALYNDLGFDDAKIEDYLILMVSLSSVLLRTITDDTIPFLEMAIRNKGMKYVQYQCCITAAYIGTMTSDYLVTRSKLFFAMKHIVKANQQLSYLAVPIIYETISQFSKRGKKVLYLYHAADQYARFKQMKYSVSCFWKSYNVIKETGWSKLEQLLLLKISSISETPIELHKFLSNKNIYFVPKTITKLRKLNLDSPVQLGSAFITNVQIPFTGFKQDVPPDGIRMERWSFIRKILFPVSYASSMDISWSNYDADDAIDTVNNEDIRIGFKLVPGNGFTANNISLVADSNIVSEYIDTMDFPRPQQLSLSFRIDKDTIGSVNGISFSWNGVAPVLVPFPSPLRFRSIGDFPCVKMNLHMDQTTMVKNSEYTFYVELEHDAKLKSLCCFIDSDSKVTVVSPETEGFRSRLNMDPETRRIDFKIVPSSSGQLSIFFIYTISSSSQSRYVYKSVHINCLEFPGLIIKQENGSLVLNDNSHVTEVTCNCAGVLLSGNTISFISAKDCNETPALFITREFGGAVIHERRPIRSFYLKFDTGTYPEITLTFFCFGHEDGTLLFEQPKSEDFYWIGKMSHRIHGSNKYTIKAKILVTKAGNFDIGESVIVRYDGFDLRMSHRISLD